MGSNKLTGAVNQQERLDCKSRILRDHMPNITIRDEDMVRPAWRHAEPGRNDLAPVEAKGLHGGNKRVGPYPMQP